MEDILDVIGRVVYSSPETKQHSFDTGKYVVDNGISGDIIECGVAAGGNFAAMILGAIENPIGRERTFWGFDSFEGIQLAGNKDTVQAGIGAISHDVNVPYDSLLKSSGITVHSKQNVIENLTSWGLYGQLKINLVEGWVQNTITDELVSKINSISILRLDMDIYHPTIFTLNKFYPLISKGGVIIIDDWALDGVRIACQEYFKENGITLDPIHIANSTPVYFIV